MIKLREGRALYSHLALLWSFALVPLMINRGTQDAAWSPELCISVISLP